MENLNSEMEKRVWQRVNGKKPPDMPALGREHLKPWVMESQENAAAFRALALQLIGKQWECLRRLESESMRMAYCLRGVGTLGGECVKLLPVPQPRDQPRRALEKCLRRSMKLWEEMDRRREDPEFGMIFSRLQSQAGDHCTAIAELLGKLEQ